MSVIDENNNLPPRGKSRSLKRKNDDTRRIRSPYFYTSGDHSSYSAIKKTISKLDYGRMSLLRLDDSFFSSPCINLAQALLGKVLVRKMPSGVILKGMIVETESYLGIEDKASHSYNGKKTDRNTAMFLKPGTAYVYSIYGMYYCFNISSLEEGSAILIRALEPLEGNEIMLKHRNKNRKSSSADIKTQQLCNGPSKLCQAFKIDKQLFNKVDLTLSESLWIEEGKFSDSSSIISCKRIGIDSYGEEWANKPLRFYVKGNKCVSRRCKISEKISEDMLNLPNKQI